MKVNIKRIDSTLPLPNYATKDACCFDLYTRETKIIPPHTIALIPTNIILEVPLGHMLLIAARSSTPKKKGLLVPHGMGIIDRDYHGPNDEIWFQVLNFTDNEVIVEKGERVAQGCLVPVPQVEFNEVLEMKKVSRGGFGSTGN